MLLFISVEKKRISPITTIDPMKAPSITEKKPDKVNTPVAMLPPPASITNATPRLAPELMPRMDGPASGLLNAVCSISPEAASAAPHSNAETGLPDNKSPAGFFYFIPYESIPHSSGGDID